LNICYDVHWFTSIILHTFQKDLGVCHPSCIVHIYRSYINIVFSSTIVYIRKWIWNWFKVFFTWAINNLQIYKYPQEYLIITVHTVRVKVFNATVNIIFSYIVAVSFIGGGNQRKPPTCRKSLTNFITLMLYRVHCLYEVWSY